MWNFAGPQTTGSGWWSVVKKGQMHAFIISSDLCLLAVGPTSYPLSSPSLFARNINPISAPPLPPPSYLAFPASSRPSLFKFRSSNLEPSTSFDDDDQDSEPHSDFDSSDTERIQIEIEKIGNNSRRIRSEIVMEASLETVWNILTDYERLADFIPGLVSSQLLEKRDNFARLFQIGQQSLAFGLKFNAKGIIDCYEKELEILPFGQRRDIDFKMIEGDFQLFEGKWSIEQCNIEKCEDGATLADQQFYTTLSYVVDVEPKLWLPVGLLEGRLCKEIKMNLLCVREEAQKAIHEILPAQE